MEPVNISLFIHSRVSNSTSVIHYIDPVCHQAGMRPRFWVLPVRDAETGEGVPETAESHSDINHNVVFLSETQRITTLANPI